MRRDMMSAHRGRREGARAAAGAVAQPGGGAGLGAPIRRRSLLGGFMGAAAALTGGSILAACGPTTAAQPQTLAQPTVLTMLPTSPFAAFPIAVQQQILDQASASFRAKNGNLQIRLVEPGFQGPAQTSMIAGNGPDVMADWIMTGYTSVDLLLDLAPLIQRDNVSLANFLPGQLEYYNQAAKSSPTNPNGLFGLPAYINTIVYAVNLSVLNQAGISAPTPGSTWQDWTQMWQGTVRNASGTTPRRYGGWVDWRGYDHTYNMPSPWVFHGFGGGYVDASNSAQSALASTASISCGEWAYDLIWSGVCNGSPNFAGGLVTSFVQQSGDMITPARTFKGFEWDFFGPPVWPVRKTSYAGTDFVGIWAGTKHPNEAWALLQWLTVGSEWQRTLMKSGLISPNQPSLWEEWKTLVTGAIPLLASKNLQVMVDQVQAQTPYGGNLFKNASNEDKAALAAMAPPLRQNKAAVAQTYRQLATQIAGIESTAATSLPALEAARQQAAKEFPVRGRAVASVPPGL